MGHPIQLHVIHGRPGDRRAQQRRIGEVVGSKSWRPLRVDLHPDGRARVVYVALTAPHTHFLASEKPPTDGTLRAESLSPIGTWLREGHELDDSPHWRTVMDLRLAPSPDAAGLCCATREISRFEIFIEYFTPPLSLPPCAARSPATVHCLMTLVV